MDNLKKHIDKNRAELDRVETPDLDKIWAGIQMELREETPNLSRPDLRGKEEQRPPVSIGKRQFTLWVVATAASIALLVGIGIGQFSKVDLVEEPPFNLANYAPELEQQAEVFQQLVAQKMAEMDVQNIDKSLYQDVFDELADLDKEYDEFAKDVPQYVQEQELIKFLTRHYEQKIRILEILSKEIEKKAHYEEREINL